MNKRVLIASPVQQKPEVLRHFLESLANLEQEQLQVHFMFIDNNEDPSSRSLLSQFQQEQENVTIVTDTEVQAYRRDEHTHYWNDKLVDKVAAMKDQIIEHALQHPFDALFLIDSDLLVHPNTLSRLAASGKQIISNIFWTRWQPDSAPLPQVWMMDEYLFYRQASPKLSDPEIKQQTDAFLNQLRIPGIYEVGGLGACTWISRSALEKGVRFRRMSNVSFWGEDRHFCIRAAALGIAMYVDTRWPAYHIYRDSDLAGVDGYKRSIATGKEQSGITISLCMIVKDEEASIAQCLSSIAGVADEIIIVDTGSTDGTREVVKAFTDHIYDFAWIDDFAAARNYAFSKATQDYILWLDADDVLKEEDRQAFLALKSTLDPATDSVMMHYNLAFDANGKPTASLKRNRLIKRSRNFRWIGAVHEYLEVSGIIIHSDIAVTHTKQKAHTDRNLLIYRRRAEANEPFSPRDLYYYANELKDHSYYEEAVVQYEKFLSLKQGWVEDRIAACLKAAECYGHLYEREHQLRSLFRSMEYDTPRAESCCQLGALFLSEDRLKEAVYWYEAATRLGSPPESGTFIQHANWTWIPYLQLCVCYDRLGRFQEAYHSNEKALELNPDHPSMKQNKLYLEKRLAAEAQKS